jgi:hypothetical protein
MAYIYKGVSHQDSMDDPFSSISAKAIVAERDRKADEEQRAIESRRLQGRNDLLASKKLPKLFADMTEFFLTNGSRTYRISSATIKELTNGVTATTTHNRAYWCAAYETLVEGLRRAGFNVHEEDGADDLWVTIS